ncbi:Stk1 family PASTA domain-containing Ser/Thr kinase [Eubacteriales bacterium OttesenSCG-928-N13]|nr:Stk1 family PASTA domain-containing Ser/Thr kinase [Eubacteriales bacterium OttesenSCG-928-N13]
MTDRILSNRYVLSEVVGTGGMAVVYRAWDRVQLREVAVKVLRSEYNADDDFVRRFNHEAHAAAKMSHPNIVNMYDVGQDGDMRYIVMEYVRGKTLKDLIRQTGKLKPQRAVAMALRILAAVDHAHKSHVVHRDIKPQNILVDAEGNIKVADFGIARATNTNTQTYADGESVLGSVHYFSPEQASGQTADEKSDLYSVGVVLYEMVTGHVPFDGDTPVAVALKHVQEVPKSTRIFDPEISKGLDEVIMKSLEKDSDKRYQTATGFAADLKRAIRLPKGGFVGVQTLTKEEQQILKQERKERRQQVLRHLRNYGLVALIATLIVLGAIKGRDWYRELFARIQAPNVMMLDLEDAVAQLDELGLLHTIDEKHYDDVSYGTVVTQEPVAGTPMWPGERIKLGVSIGKEKLRMPKLLELTRSEAMRLIEENDMILSENDVTLVISEAAVGTVVSQEPAVNEWVKPGDKVKLSISGESAPVPMVLGVPLENAKNSLISSGFTVDSNVIERLSTEEEGTVIAQSVDAGMMALLGAPIQLTISQVRQTTYRAQKKFWVAIPSGGADVRCTVEQDSQEIEQYAARLEQEGNQAIGLDLEADTPGNHTVRMYVNGELKIEEAIEFG